MSYVRAYINHRIRSNGQNPQAKWKKVKLRHQRKYHQITEEERKKANKNDKRSQKRHGDPEQRISSNNPTTENRKKNKRGIFCSSKLPK